jgi:DNA-directed RNA polymerase specialized sigma24 family protein
MRARWEGLHTALVGSVTTLEMNRQFEQARKATPELQPFATVTSFLEFLERESSDLEDKNTIYSALVRAVQAPASWAPLAWGVLWCGMWSGLDAVYQRQRRYFANDPEELISLISEVFTTLVGDLDLQCVQRVAATLVRSTERDVVRTRQRQRATELGAELRDSPPLAGSLDGSTEPVETPDVPDPSGISHSALGIPVGLSREAQAAAVHRWLLEAVGEDATLFLAVVVLGQDPRQIAQQAGLSYVALRKRIQRIRTRLANRCHNA